MAESTFKNNNDTSFFNMLGKNSILNTPPYNFQKSNPSNMRKGAENIFFRNEGKIESNLNSSNNSFSRLINVQNINTNINNITNINHFNPNINMENNNKNSNIVEESSYLL